MSVESWCLSWPAFPLRKKKEQKKNIIVCEGLIGWIKWRNQTGINIAIRNSFRFPRGRIVPEGEKTPWNCLNCSFVYLLVYLFPSDQYAWSVDSYNLINYSKIQNWLRCGDAYAQQISKAILWPVFLTAWFMNKCNIFNWKPNVIMICGQNHHLYEPRGNPHR